MGTRKFEVRGRWLEERHIALTRLPAAQSSTKEQGWVGGGCLPDVRVGPLGPGTSPQFFPKNILGFLVLASVGTSIFCHRQGSYCSYGELE